MKEWGQRPLQQPLASESRPYSAARIANPQYKAPVVMVRWAGIRGGWELMDGDSDIMGGLIKALIAIAVVLGIYVGVKILPYYLRAQEFESSMQSQARILGGSEARVEDLRNAIYRSAQDKNLPVQRDDIQVDYTPAGAHVAADYTVVADLGFGQLPLHFHPQYPRRQEGISAFHRGILAALGLILGLFWFFKGFRLFLEYKVIEDTPLIPIRSVAMGRVQIQGKAVGEKTMRSPVSNQPCFLYKVDIDRWVQARQGAGGRWQPYRGDVASVGFYLQDETGKVLIDPRGAELDLDEETQTELGAHGAFAVDAPSESEWSGETPPGIPPPDSELRRYVMRVVRGMNTAPYQGGDLPLPSTAPARPPKPRRSFSQSLRGLIPAMSIGDFGSGAAPGDYRLTEYCVLPDNEYDITGTCAINPHSQNDLDRQVITKGVNDKTFLISNQAEKVLEQDLRWRAWKHVLGGGALAVMGAAVLLEALGLIV